MSTRRRDSAPRSLEETERREFDVLGDCDYLQTPDYHNWMCYSRSENYEILGVFCTRCGRWGRFLYREVEQWQVRREQRLAAARRRRETKK